MAHPSLRVPIIWRPVIGGCVHLIGTIDGVEVGYVGHRPDGRWVSKVMHRADWSRHMEACVGSEAAARKMVERWWSHHPLDVHLLQRERQAWKEAMGLSPPASSRARIAAEQRVARNPPGVRLATGLSR